VNLNEETFAFFLMNRVFKSIRKEKFMKNCIILLYLNFKTTYLKNSLPFNAN
jgi:hypothetical protein